MNMGENMKQMDQRVVETIRLLSVDGIQKANSGHPGLPMGAATMAYVLWKDHLNVTSVEPNWENRDRFILSAGHGSMLLYSLLHLFGYKLSIDDLKEFRQFGSLAPGHPEYGVTEGVEMTTGPLGQGLASAVGMAIAQKHMEAIFSKSDNNIIDHYTYVLAGDGDLMEGVTSEAGSLAGHLKLGKLIVLYDDNSITIDGSTDKAFTEDVEGRYISYGWEVINVEDGNDFDAISDAISKAKRNIDKPTLIKVKTIIGYGSPNKAGTSGVHGSPLGEDEIKLIKTNMGWDPKESFVVPEDVKDYLKQIISQKEEKYKTWQEQLEKYKTDYKDLYDKWQKWQTVTSDSKYLDENLFSDEKLDNMFNEKEATRVSGGKMLNYIAEHMPNIIGGSADLNSSTKTFIKGGGDFSAENPEGKNIYYGIREHAMAAIMNGISLYGTFRTFGSTFLVFSDYLKPSIRLSALMNQPVIYVFTHDSIGVGEDGPTHQPIEHLMMLRAIPNVTVFRPADAKETAVAWVEAMKRVDGPSVIILTRQNLNPLDKIYENAHKGAYVVGDKAQDAEVLIMASGSEVDVALEAQEILLKKNIKSRVVSMMSFEIFEQQSEEYKNEVLDYSIKNRVSIEAGLTSGWEKYTGFNGINIGINEFGASASGGVLMEHFGFTAQKVAGKILDYLRK